MKSFVFLLAALTAIAGLMAIGPSPSGATCTSRNFPNEASALGAWEHARWRTTCDGLNDYYGVIYDRKKDNRCATVTYMDAGQQSLQGIDCTHAPLDHPVIGERDQAQTNPARSMVKPIAPAASSNAVLV